MKPNQQLNTRRRNRYADDPEYRAYIMEDRRTRYRNSRGVNIRDCGKTLSQVQSEAIIRDLDGYGPTLCLSTAQLAGLMDYHYITVSRWQNAEIFPRPNLKLARGKHSMFSVRQANLITKIMAEHQKTHQYLYAKDHTTISRLFTAAI